MSIQTTPSPRPPSPSPLTPQTYNGHSRPKEVIVSPVKITTKTQTAKSLQIIQTHRVLLPHSSIVQCVYHDITCKKKKSRFDDCGNLNNNNRKNLCDKTLKILFSNIIPLYNLIQTATSKHPYPHPDPRSRPLQFQP